MGTNSSVIIRVCLPDPDSWNDYCNAGEMVKKILKRDYNYKFSVDGHVLTSKQHRKHYYIVDNLQEILNSYTEIPAGTYFEIMIVEEFEHIRKIRLDSRSMAENDTVHTEDFCQV